MSLAFLDSNVLIYALLEERRTARAQELLYTGGAISVQCLNEFASVMRGKQRWSWTETAKGLAALRELCAPIIPLDEALHENGLRLAERYRLSVYDGMIVAAALVAGCDLLWSEDMQDGLFVEGRLRIVNPFREA